MHAYSTATLCARAKFTVLLADRCYATRLAALGILRDARRFFRASYLLGESWRRFTLFGFGGTEWTSALPRGALLFALSLVRFSDEDVVVVRFLLRVGFGREHLNCDAMIFGLSC